MLTVITVAIESYRKEAVQDEDALAKSVASSSARHILRVETLIILFHAHLKSWKRSTYQLPIHKKSLTQFNIIVYPTKNCYQGKCQCPNPEHDCSKFHI